MDTGDGGAAFDIDFIVGCDILLALFHVLLVSLTGTVGAGSSVRLLSSLYLFKRMYKVMLK